ncbi:MAG: RecX family transcriptional regulator [Candidatus Cloacimonetes bacterium]|nr:RecX family transcriptional regulator [Candidatus Cloacimonadota bacterium]
MPNKILYFFALFPDAEQEVSEEIWQDIEIELEKFAWQKLLNFLAYRERSEKECSLFFKKNLFNEELSQRLISKAIKLNYLNSERFAELFVQSLIEQNRSKNEIVNKLYEKGIENEVTHKLLLKYYQSAHIEILKQNILKVAKRYSQLPKNKQREKILNNLIRKGFSYSEIISEVAAILATE